MKNLFIISILITSFYLSLNAQIWDGRDADFPTSLFGSGIYAIDETVAWCWGEELNNNGINTYANGAISVTSDGGLTWKNVDFVTKDSCVITSLSALNDQIVWVTFITIQNGFTSGNFVA